MYDVGTANVFKLPDPSTPSAKEGVALVIAVNRAVDPIRE
jgi:hypothetical protein